MEGASVRNIAKEAGLSPGALRHDFSTQEELLRYAMELVKEKATVRIKDLFAQDLNPKDKLLRILLEIVPTSEETRAEMEVWMAFTAYFRHKQDNFDPHQDGIYMLVGKLIAYMEGSGLLRQGVNQAMEAERLYALIDGIALHALMAPDRLDKQQISRLLMYHMDSILN